MVDILPFLPGMIVLLALSAVFSGSETALFSLTAAQVHQLRTSRHRLDHLVGRILRDPESLLITLLICNMIINVVYFTLASVASMQLLKRPGGAGGWQVSAWALAALLGLVLFGEVAPKVLAFAFNTRIAALTAVAVFLAHQGLRPAHRLLRTAVVRPLTRLARPDDHAGREVTVEELGELLEISERRGLLHADETMMLHEILELAEIKVAQVMVPRVQVVAFDADRPLGELRDLLRSSGRSRLPVYRGDLDHVLGWAETRRVFLSPLRPLSELLTPVHFVAELATVEQLLLEFRRTRTSRAIVVDEFGGTAGLVTLQDVLEEIVGEIQDAQSPTRRPMVEQVGPLRYSISGQLPIHDWAETFGHELDDPRIVTVAGLVVKLLGRMPRVGDRIAYGNIAFTVESMSGRRIERLDLALQPAAEAVP